MPVTKNSDHSQDVASECLPHLISAELVHQLVRKLSFLGTGQHRRDDVEIVLFCCLHGTLLQAAHGCRIFAAAAADEISPRSAGGCAGGTQGLKSVEFWPLTRKHLVLHSKGVSCRVCFSRFTFWDCLWGV